MELLFYFSAGNVVLKVLTFKNRASYI